MTKTKKQEDGLITIVSVIIIILIISVITLSLAIISRRSLRQSIDEQLSSQATYAAESGVNDAVKNIKSGRITNITDCNSVNDPALFNPKLTDDGSVRYTCVIVNRVSDNIETYMPKDSLKSYPLEDDRGYPVQSVTIKWTKPSGTINTSNCTTTSCLFPLSSWSDKLGLLRIRLVPNPPTTRTDMDARTIDITAYPFNVSTTSGGSTYYPNTVNVNSSKNHVMSSNCAGGTCTITLNGLDTGGGKYYIQMYSYFNESSIVLSGNSNNSGAPVPTKYRGAQITIDSTGVAQDIVKRLKIKIPINDKSDLPLYSLGVGENLCKRFVTNSFVGVTRNDTSGGAPPCNAF